MSYFSRQPREKEYDAVCLIVDVGLTTKRSGFLDSIIRCCSEQVQRKMYSESNDRFGIVLCGTRSSRNCLDYEHVTVLDVNDGCMAVANFGLLEFIEKKAKALASDSEGDWLDAVVVAMDMLKKNTEDSKACKNKKIILFSDLGCPSNEDELETIVKNMKKENVEFTFIGPEWKDDDDMDEGGDNGNNGASNDEHSNGKPKTETQCHSEAMVQYLVDQTGGFKTNVDVALAIFLNKERKQKRPAAWKVDLEIGGSIKIPVVGYVHIRRENPKQWKKCLAKASANADADVWELKPEVTYVKNDEDLTVVEPEDLIESFRYGSELIAVSEVDRGEPENYGSKSLKLVGFIKQQEIPIHLVLGDGSMIFQPIEGNQSSISGMSALVNALDSEEMVAIVRRVYQAKSSPKLGVLVPSRRRNPDTQEESIVLTYIEMPFMEDIRYFSFAPVYSDNIKPSDEQLAAIDGLIDALKVEDPNVLQTETILNPYFQHLYQCLTHRALNPGKILTKTSDYIKNIMDIPEELKKASEVPIFKVKEVFKLEEVVAKQEKNTGDKVFGGPVKRASSSQSDSSTEKKIKLDDLSLSDGSNTVEVGTTTPVEDFESLLKKGFDLSTVAIQLEKVILNFLQTTFGGDFSDKILASLSAYRQASLDLRRPSNYNNFLQDLKPEILASKFGRKLWDDIVEQDLCLISKQEENNSSVTVDESDEFKKVSTESGSNDTGMDVEANDEASADDLLDDL